MQEERERGRIAGLRTRRLRMAERARALVPTLEQARRELPEKGETGQPSDSDVARWLNSHHYLNDNGKSWRPQTVARLFDTHISLIDGANSDLKAILEIIRYKSTISRRDFLEGLREEEKYERKQHREQIVDAYRLAADLRGLPFSETDVPPIPIIEARGRPRPLTRIARPLTRIESPSSDRPSESPSQIKCESKNESVEHQLSLFDAL